MWDLLRTRKIDLKTVPIRKLAQNFVPTGKIDTWFHFQTQNLILGRAYNRQGESLLFDAGRIKVFCGKVDSRSRDGA